MKEFKAEVRDHDHGIWKEVETCEQLSVAELENSWPLSEEQLQTIGDLARGAHRRVALTDGLHVIVERTR